MPRPAASWKPPSSKARPATPRPTLLSPPASRVDDLAHRHSAPGPRSITRSPFGRIACPPGSKPPGHADHAPSIHMALNGKTDSLGPLRKNPMMTGNRLSSTLLTAALLLCWRRSPPWRRRSPERPVRPRHDRPSTASSSPRRRRSSAARSSATHRSRRPSGRRASCRRRARRTCC